MIKKLRNRFVLYVMLSLVIVVSLIAAFFYAYYSYQETKEDKLLLMWTAKNGSITLDTIDEFYAFSDQSQSNRDINVAAVYGITALKYDKNDHFMEFDSTVKLRNANKKTILRTEGDKIMKKQKTSGKVDNYRYTKVKKDYGTYLVMMDTNITGISNYIPYVFFGLTVLFFLFLLFLISLFLSRFVTKPTAEGIAKQKQFIADASHELKTPLAAILLNAEALHAETGDNKYLKNIQSEASRMEKLVKNLLDLARTDDETIELPREAINLSDAVMQMTLPFESIAFESKITYDTEIQEDIIYYGNGEYIQQLVSILLDNAFKHTHEYGTVQVNLKKSAGSIRLEVTNTGSGIRQSDLPHVFERFYSCDASRNSETNSYGLGLAIAKAIVEKHGGTITARSEYGRYAKFTVTL